MLLTNPFRPDPRVLREAKTLKNEGHKVEILCWNRGENFPAIENVEGIVIRRLYIPSSYGKPLDFIKGIFKFYVISFITLKNRRYDIVHAHDFDTLPLAILLKKLYGYRIIYDAHDHYTSMVEDVLPSFITKILRKLERKLVVLADGRIAATKELGESIFKDLPFTVIMNAKSLEDFDVDEEKINEIKKRINPNNNFLIVYIGILKLWTPLPDLIKVVKKLQGVRLVIGGDGPHKKEILKMIEGVGNIKYIGWVKSEEIPLYTHLSDIIVLPSNDRKEYTRVSVPNKLMEALAAGKPIIAGKNTAGEKIANECNAGLICKFGDIKCIEEKIRYLMRNEEMRRKLGENARKCAERKYNWRVMERRLLSLYSRLM